MSGMGAGLALIPLVSRAREEANKSGVNFDYMKNGSDYDISLIRIADPSASPVVIGRYRLLKSFRAACNLHKSGGGDHENISYPETHRWAAKALSREMLRFSDAGMQIRGNHTVIRINNTNILSSTIVKNDVDENIKYSVGKEIVEAEQEGGWSVNPVKVGPGDILSIEPRVGQGRMEFGVVDLNQSTQHEKVSAVLKNNYTENTSADESTDPRETDHTGDSVQEKEYKSDKVTLDDDSKRRNPNKTNTPIRINSINPPTLSFLVYFFPFGNGFSASRRQKLEHNLKILGATIVDNLWEAKYIVISESIRSLSVLANRMRVKEERLVAHLENSPNVRCVLPSWADYCISSVKRLAIPSRMHAWCHSSTSTITPNITTTKITVKRMRDAIVDKNEKQTAENDARSQKRKIGKNDNTIQIGRKWYFRRNAQVAEAFKDLADLHESMSLIPADTWKSYSFRIVAGRILELDFEINDDEETQRRLRSIKGFGKSVCEKIQECIDHGTIIRIQEFKCDPQRQAMKNIKDIWGVGTVRASDLIDRGYRTIDDVRRGIREGKLSLDRNQLVGVDCYEDILDQMSRSEVEAIGEMVRLIAESIYPGIETSIMGSYRRGKDYCGDVDIQLTHPAFDKSIPTDALGRIIDKLWNEGKIAMHLTFLVGMKMGLDCTAYQKASQHLPKEAWERTKTLSNQTEYKFYMGCLYSPIKPRRRRRVDIKFYPYRERAFATLYFTGNGYFNRSMRLWATRVFGLKLSDHGLFDRSDGKTRVFEASTEREIFDRLQLAYREPDERHYWDALEPLDKDIEADLRLTESELKDDRKNPWVK